MVFLTLLLALLLAAVLIMMLRERQQKSELAVMLERTREDFYNKDHFLNGMFVEMRQGGGIAGAMQVAARYIAEQTGGTAAAIYECTADDRLAVIGAWGPYPLVQCGNRLLLNKPKHLYELLKREQTQMGRGFIGSVAAGVRAERVVNPLTDERFKAYPAENLKGSVLAMPLQDQGKVVGVACVFGSTEGTDGQFSDAQYDRFRMQETPMVMALELVRAYSEVSTRDRIDQELEFARQIQHSLLPQSFPDWDQFSVTAFSRSAKEVNGDFYDFVQIDEDRLLVVIGDACGKGVPACMLSAMTRSMIRAMADNFTNLGDFLRELNRKMYRGTDADRFITLGCCLLDRKNSLMEFGRAGHTELLAFMRDHIRAFSPQGAALGILPDEFSEFETFCTAFEPGMSLLLFSDGLTEAVNADGVEFGMERLQDLFRLSCINGESARNAINLMLEEVGSYEADQGDDQTLIIIQHM